MPKQTTTQPALRRPSGPTQPEADAPKGRGRPSRTRAPILQAARALFLSRGFEAVSMDALAEEAGVARRSLYNQFPGKEDVFKAMFEQLWADLDGEALREAEADPDHRRGLTTLGRAVAAYWARPDVVALNRLVIAEGRRFPWIAAQHRQMQEAMLARFELALARLVEEGRCVCPHPKLAAMQFVSLLAGFLLWPQVSDGATVPGAKVEVVVAEAVEMFTRRYAP